MGFSTAYCICWNGDAATERIETRETCHSFSRVSAVGMVMPRLSGLRHRLGERETCHSFCWNGDAATERIETLILRIAAVSLR